MAKKQSLIQKVLYSEKNKQRRFDMRLSDEQLENIHKIADHYDTTASKLISNFIDQLSIENSDIIKKQSKK